MSAESQQLKALDFYDVVDFCPKAGDEEKKNHQDY